MLRSTLSVAVTPMLHAIPAIVTGQDRLPTAIAQAQPALTLADIE